MTMPNLSRTKSYELSKQKYGEYTFACVIVKRLKIWGLAVETNLNAEIVRIWRPVDIDVAKSPAKNI